MASNKEKTQEHYLRIKNNLATSGFEIDDKFAKESNDAGLFWVMIEDFAYQITYDASDEEFYRIVFPLTLNEKIKHKPKALEGVNAANSSTKLAKAYIDGEGDLIIVLDALAVSAKIFVSDFSRYVDAIQTALKVFNKTVES